MAQGPYYVWFAIVVGLVVSLDVFVVELTRDYSPSPEVAETPGRRMYMARMHALFHAGAFLIYSFALVIVDKISIKFFDWIDVPDGVSSAFVTAFVFFIILFVWWTYKGKVAEDHSTKDAVGAEVDRYDMQLLVNLWNAVTSSSRMSGAVIAGSVAVDMLAVSALLKIWLLPVNGAEPISSKTGLLWIDLLIFGAVIGVVVFGVVLIAHRLREYISSSRFVMTTLRVIEPLFIFYILTGAIRTLAYLLEMARTDFLVNIPVWLIDWSISTLLVVTLFVANRMSLRQLAHLSVKRSMDSAGSGNDSATISEVFREVTTRWPQFLMFAGMFALVLGCLAWAFVTGDEHDHLIEATGYFSAIVTFATIVVLYAPSRIWDLWELDQSKAFTNRHPPNIGDHWFEFVGASVAIAMLNGMLFVAIDMDLFSWAPMLWSVYIVGAWLMFNLRRTRFCRTSSLSESKIGKRDIDRIRSRHNDIGYSELVSSIGLSSAVVAVVALWIVSTYF